MAGHLQEISVAISIVLGLVGLAAIFVRQGRFAERVLARMDGAERDIKSVKRVIFMDDGSLSVVTHASHDRMQADCQRLINQQITSIFAAVGKIEICVAEMNRRQQEINRDDDDRWNELRGLIIKLQTKLEVNQ